VIHLDNCPIHTSRVSTNWLEEHDIIRIPQPSYSPGLALSDFDLFPTAKKSSNGFSWLTRTRFFESLQAILSSLDHEQLYAVFQAWARRVQEVSEGNGGYVG
jgi:hypothetical protein